MFMASRESTSVWQARRTEFLHHLTRPQTDLLNQITFPKKHARTLKLFVVLFVDRISAKSWPRDDTMVPATPHFGPLWEGKAMKAHHLLIQPETLFLSRREFS